MLNVFQSYLVYMYPLEKKTFWQWHQTYPGQFFWWIVAFLLKTHKLSMHPQVIVLLERTEMYTILLIYFSPSYNGTRCSPTPPMHRPAEPKEEHTPHWAKCLEDSPGGHIVSSRTPTSAALPQGTTPSAEGAHALPAGHIQVYNDPPFSQSAWGRVWCRMSILAGKSETNSIGSWNPV